jgi:uncharacterized coiled-coil protein SlyX
MKNNLDFLTQTILNTAKNMENTEKSLSPLADTVFEQQLEIIKLQSKIYQLEGRISDLNCKILNAAMLFEDVLDILDTDND